MLRIVSLTLVLVLSTGALLPLTGSSAHGLRESFISKRSHHRRHSRAWWRRYRLRMARIRLMRRQQAEMMAMAHRRFVLKPVMPVPLAKVNATPVSIPAAELVLASIPRTAPTTVAPTVPVSSPTVASSTSVPVTALPPASRTVPTPATVPVPRFIRSMVSAPVALTVPAPPARVPAPTSRTIAAHPLKTVRADASLTVPALATKTVLAGAAKPLATTVRTTVPAPVSGPQLPAGWNALGATKNGEMRFRTETSTGVTNGQASLDVVAQSRPNPLYIDRKSVV